MVCRFGLGACCPTCPNICKEFAREEKTFTNTTIDLDCNDFDDPTCYFDDCPSKCAASYSRGERNDACAQYEDKYPGCFLPCPQRCRDSYDNGEMKQSVLIITITATGERNEECEKYSSVPQCFLPCPT